MDAMIPYYNACSNKAQSIYGFDSGNSNYSNPKEFQEFCLSKYNIALNGVGLATLTAKPGVSTTTSRRSTTTTTLRFATATTTFTSSINTNNSSSDVFGGKLTTYIGTGIGVLVAVAILFWCCCRKSTKKPEPVPQHVYGVNGQFAPQTTYVYSQQQQQQQQQVPQQTYIAGPEPIIPLPQSIYSSQQSNASYNYQQQQPQQPEPIIPLPSTYSLNQQSTNSYGSFNEPVGPPPSSNGQQYAPPAGPPPQPINVYLAPSQPPPQRLSINSQTSYGNTSAPSNHAAAASTGYDEPIILPAGATPSIYTQSSNSFSVGPVPIPVVAGQSHTYAQLSEPIRATDAPTATATGTPLTEKERQAQEDAANAARLTDGAAAAPPPEYHELPEHMR
ncbi:hypothetical protein BDR26DRAFT_848850, partial [Obelidium mucronatum]